jgi:hypothetical protein
MSFDVPFLMLADAWAGVEVTSYGLEETVDITAK